MALRLGVWDVEGMLAQMTLPQFRLWKAYADLEPFDETRADLRAASIVQAVINMQRDPKKHGPVKLSECTLRFGEEAEKKPTKTWQEMKMIGQMAAMEFNALPPGKARSRPKRDRHDG